MRHLDVGQEESSGRGKDSTQALSEWGGKERWEVEVVGDKAGQSL